MAQLGSRGARLARYAVGPELARGAMGQVVQAWDEELRREVALKIQRGHPGDARMRRRFLEEAQIAAQLDHPGIVPIHELGLDESGRPFFSMKLVRGHHLGEILVLAQNGAEGWSRTRVLHVLLRVCEAMAFAHNKGVVHRDLKPANIMVGGFGETYVMDWGLAHVAGRSPTSDANGALDISTLRAEIAGDSDLSPLLTHTGDVIGTPAYMAPEQAAGSLDKASAAVDVYAVGAILYHLLAGHMPYGEAGSLEVDAVLTRVRAEAPVPLPDETAPELRAICERAMARAASDRYVDMSALADDLRAFLEVRTVRAYATGRFAELRKWIARNQALAASSLTLLVLLAAGSVVVTALWLRAEDDRSRADAGAEQLQTALDRSAFRSARLALQLDDSIEAGDALWRAHFTGRMPRATTWALSELCQRDPYLLTLPIHANSQAIAFADAIGAVLVGGTDGRLQVRDADTLELRAELGTTATDPTCIAATADGRWAVVGNASGELLVYDLAELREVRRVKAHRGTLRCIAPGPKSGFATGGEDGQVLWWTGYDAEPRNLLKHDNDVSALVVTPLNDGVMAADVRGNVSGVAFDKSWGLKFSVGSHVTALACGERSSDLFVGSTDHYVRFFDFIDKSRNWAQPTHNGTCRQLARDRDGSVFAGGWWRTGRFGADGTSLAPAALRGIWRLAFSQERRRLLTSGATCGLGLVDVSDNGRRVVSGGNMALSADGRRLVKVEGNHTAVIDVDSNTVVRQSEAGMTGKLKLDTTGSLVAIMAGRVVHVAETDSGRRRFTTEGPADNPFGDSCAFSPNSEELAVCVGTRSIQRLRCSDGSLIAEYSFPGTRTTRIVYSADGSTLAVIGRDDGVVRVYHLAEGRRADIEFDRRLPTGTLTSLSAVALDPTGERIAVGTWNGGVMVRERDGRTITIPAHEGSVWSLQFLTNDPGLLISSGGASGICFWDLDSSECCYHTERGNAGAVQVSNDGRTLACQRTDGVLLLDLTYRHRHIAGNLLYQLERQSKRLTMPEQREQELRAWAATELARPWPRWH